jgi:hypothetical protein
MQRIKEKLPRQTPLQLACEMAECRMLFLSTDDDEARDQWRGEYEAIKSRYDALLQQLRKDSSRHRHGVTTR